MKIIVYDKNTKKGSFTNYGYGQLRMVEKCEVTEELNGRYDAELIVSLDDPKQKYLTKWAIVSIDGQLFRVVTRVDYDLDNVTKVYARHIFYDINYGFVEDQRADTQNVLMTMQIARPEDFNHFEVFSDIEEKNTLYFVKNTGAENMFAIIDRWGQGELIRDNFKISINKAKGNDNGVTFTYKKMEAIEITDDATEVVTRLYPSGKDGITLQEKYIEIPNWNDEEYPPFHITREVKFDDAEDEGSLRTLATAEAERIGLSRVNFLIKVNDLENTNLYRHVPDLMKVIAGDIVTIKHQKLNVRVKVKCIKRVHDKVTNKLTLEFGQPNHSFFESIDNSNVKVDIPSTTEFTNSINYFENGKQITIGTEAAAIGELSFATLNETNVMVNVSASIYSTGAALIESYFQLDYLETNQVQRFKPKLHLQPGYNLFNVTFPLLFLESHMMYDCRFFMNCKDNITVEGEVVQVHIEPYQLQMTIQGQRLAAGVEKPGKPEFEDKIDIPELSVEDVSKLGGVEFLMPIVIIENEKKDIINTFDEPVINAHGNFQSVYFDVGEYSNDVVIGDINTEDVNKTGSVIIELGGN